MNSTLHVAVVGHTNVGKTSLLRTLTRDETFGEVSPSPATTRHVERASLVVEGHSLLELFDTPGLEDSGNLLTFLERLRARRQTDWAGALELFLADEELQSGFEQEAKALQQLTRSQVAFYVIDARDKVRSKHRDELEILTRAARPILPILNFVASPEADAEAWRAALARVNLHTLIQFDSVVFDEADELKLYERLKLLAEPYAPILERVTTHLRARRAALKEAAAQVIAALLIDTAAMRLHFATKDIEAKQRAADALKALVRQREEQAVTDLLALFDFSARDYVARELPISEGRWQEDLFDPDSLARFGFSASRAAATGATAGLAIDLMVGGLTLGAAALTGATLGVIIDTVGRHGRQWRDRLRGVAELQVADETLALLLLRESLLVRTLLRRGHGSVAPLGPDMDANAESDKAKSEVIRKLLKSLATARQEPSWSTSQNESGLYARPAARKRLAETLAQDIGAELIGLARRTSDNP